MHQILLPNYPNMAATSLRHALLLLLSSARLIYFGLLSDSPLERQAQEDRNAVMLIVSPVPGTEPDT